MKSHNWKKLHLARFATPLTAQDTNSLRTKETQVDPPLKAGEKACMVNGTYDKWPASDVLESWPGVDLQH